jgi:hypothetical protein
MPFVNRKLLKFIDSSQQATIIVTDTLWRLLISLQCPSNVMRENARPVRYLSPSVTSRRMPGSFISSIITRKPVLVGHEMIHELILTRKAIVCEASWTEGKMTQERRGCLVNISYVACQVAFVLICPFAFVTVM